MADLTQHWLELSDFKSFKGTHKLVLDQASGLYHVSGKNKAFPELGANGVGKSTIWDALLWVLWGKTGRDNKPGSAITPWGEKAATSVRLSFSHHNKKRILERTRNPNHLLLNDKEIDQAQIAGLIGMSEEMFRRTMILGQFGTLFLDLRAEAQAQMFSEALNLDVWLKASALASASAKDASAEVIRMEKDIAANEVLRADLESQFEATTKLANIFEQEIEDQIASVKKELKLAQASLKSIESNFGERPKLPQHPKRTDEILKAIAGQQEFVAQQKEKAKRAAPKQKLCSKCQQPIQDEELQSKLDAIDQAAKAFLKKSNDELAAIRDELSKRHKAYEKELNSWQKQNDTVSATRNAVQKLTDQLDELADRENPHLQSGAQLDKRIVKLKASMIQLKKGFEIQRLRKEYGEFWQKGFKEIRLGIIDEVLLELEIAATRHASLLGLIDWRIEFHTERENKAGNVSYSFTVLLYPPDRKEPIKWESYSGGESQRLQLAVAFGLSEVLLSRAGVDPSMEVLDEPTRGLSPEGISDLIEHLRERALETKRAIYLVDHHALDRGMFDGNLLVQKTEKGSSFKWL